MPLLGDKYYQWGSGHLSQVQEAWLDATEEEEEEEHEVLGLGVAEGSERFKDLRERRSQRRF
jgi:hypothetical protein